MRVNLNSTAPLILGIVMIFLIAIPIVGYVSGLIFTSIASAIATVRRVSIIIGVAGASGFALLVVYEHFQDKVLFRKWKKEDSEKGRGRTD